MPVQWLEAGAAHVGDLTPAQLANAGAIIAEGRRRGVPAQGIVIALATASQESHFTNYANDGRGGDLAVYQRGIEQSLQLPHEAVGTDHGSLGSLPAAVALVGTMRDLMDPTMAAGKFYDALLKVPGLAVHAGHRRRPAVQRSAYPDAYADDEAWPGSCSATRPAPRASTRPASRLLERLTARSAGRRHGRVPAAPGAQLRRQPQLGPSERPLGAVGTPAPTFGACGTPVLAATAGTVVVRTDQPWAGRWLVQVSTGIGQLTTWYAHMRALTVTDGQTVTAGQQIGEVGDLGNATGCHLHFEVHPRGGSIYHDSVNPSPWLPRTSAGPGSPTQCPCPARAAPRSPSPRSTSWEPATRAQVERSRGWPRVRRGWRV